ALSGVGTLFVLLVGRFLLPDRAGAGDLLPRFRLNSFFTELTILEGSPLIGKTIDEIKTADHDEFRLVGWIRGGQPMASPYDDYMLNAGDVLRVHLTPEELMAFRAERGIELRPVDKFGSGEPAIPTDEEAPNQQLVQAVVAPTSDLI